MNLKKTLFILPNLFTFGNLFCGFLALALCVGGRGEGELYQAALAICFGFFFDLLDGRVARLTKTQSKLGLELDSLADVITFSAAPAVLVYKWGFTEFGLWGIFVCFLFVAGGAFRLARFNVLAERETPPGAEAYFVGLSAPVAAAVIVSLVIVHHRLGQAYALLSATGLAVLVVSLSYLMISRVRFRNFKKFSLTRRTLSAIFFLTVVSLIIAVKLSASLIFIFLAAVYLAAGLAEEVFRYAADKRQARRAEKAGAELAASPEEAPEEDEWVWRELSGDEP